MTLPKAWTWISVAELASAPQDITDGPFGSNLKTEHYTPAGPRVIRLQNIGDGFFVDEKAHIAPAHFERLRKHEVKPGDVIVAMLGEHLPRACIAPSTIDRAIVKADCVRLRPDAALTYPKWVSAGLNSPALRKQGDDLVHGVGRPRLGLKWFRTLCFPLAPLAEQDRVVEAVDSYLTRLDDVTATLERVQAKLKAYRASVLKAAVEGRLVPTEASLAGVEKRDYEPAAMLVARILKERRHRWEAAELARLKANGKAPKDDKWKTKYEEPVAPDTSTLPELPEGWCWSTVDQLSRSVFYGSSAKASEKGEVPVIRMGNIVDGGLDLTRLKFLPSAHEEFPGLLLQRDDLLFNRTNSAELVGKTAIYHGVPTPCSFASYLICVRVLGDVESGWICHVMNSLYGRLWIASVVTQQVGQANVNGTKLKAFPVPLPPLVEQRRLLTLMDELFSKCEACLESVVTDLRRASRLRQSILKWAFDGRLVDQDPRDEPADKLLARVREERAVVAPAKKSRGRTAQGAG